MDVPFTTEPADPRSPEASDLLRALTDELAIQYPSIGGGGYFHPEDCLGPRAVFLVGRLDGRPVACGALRPLEEDIAEVKRMFVAPEHRGKGLSRRLLAALEQHAAALGYVTVRLETGDRQTAAVALYQRSGYRPCDPFGPYVGNPWSLYFEKALVPNG